MKLIITSYAFSDTPTEEIDTSRSTAEVVNGEAVVTGPLLEDILSDGVVVDPDRLPANGRWATPADGNGWLRAVALRFLRVGYYTVSWEDERGDPCDGPWLVDQVADWYREVMDRGVVTGDDVAALLTISGAYRPANPAHRPRPAAEVPSPPPGSVKYSVDEGGCCAPPWTWRASSVSSTTSRTCSRTPTSRERSTSAAGGR